MHTKKNSMLKGLYTTSTPLAMFIVLKHENFNKTQTYEREFVHFLLTKKYLLDCLFTRLKKYVNQQQCNIYHFIKK